MQLVGVTGLANNISSEWDDLSSVLLSMQESADAKDKSAAIEYRALERRLEECVSMSSAYVNTVQTRAADLERRCNESENSQKIRFRETFAMLLLMSCWMLKNVAHLL